MGRYSFYPHFIDEELKGPQFSSVQLLSHVRLFVTPWIAACQASLSITNSRSSLKLVIFPNTLSEVEASAWNLRIDLIGK